MCWGLTCPLVFVVAALQSAWFDYTYSMYGYTAVDEAEAAQKYQVTPYSYTIMFSKSKVDS